MDNENMSVAVSSGFGELFEGETTVFESSLSGTEVVNGVDMPHHSTYQPNNKISIRTPLSLSDYATQSHSQGPFMATGIFEEENDDTFEENLCKDKTRVTVKKDVEHFFRLNLNKYLKDRGYCKILLPKTILKSSLAELIDSNLTKANGISFGPNYKSEEICEDIEKFWKFYVKLKARNKKMCLEVKPMLIPTMIYFFYEVLAASHSTVAHKIMLEFSKKFLHEDKTKENYRVLLALAKVKSPNVLEEDKTLKDVCTKRRRFILSDYTFSALKKFCSDLYRPSLLNLFTNHFVIESISSHEVAEAFYPDANSPESNSDSDERPDKAREPGDVQSVLERLRGSVQANLPEVTVYTTNGPPISGAFSHEASTVAYGLMGSGIRICSASSAVNLVTIQKTDAAEYNPAIKFLNGHEGSVYSLGFHPKSKILFSAGEDSDMRVWDLNNENYYGCRAIYKGHIGPIWSLDISGSGQLIATGGMDSSARIWVPERVDCVRIMAGHHLDVDCVRFHPNEAYIGTGSVDKSVRLWSVHDGSMARIMTGSQKKTSALAFHASGKYLVGGGDGNMIQVWDIAEGEIITELPCNSSCTDLTFCGNMLAACFKDQGIQFWNLRNIVGGDDDTRFDPSTQTINAPYTVECHSSSLFKVYYKDPSQLYCLGSDPPILEDLQGRLLVNDDHDHDDQDNSITSQSVPQTPNDNESPTFVQQLNSYECANIPDVTCSVSNSLVDTMPEEDFVQNEDLVIDCIKHSIISASDILDFPIDDQMLSELDVDL